MGSPAENATIVEIADLPGDLIDLVEHACEEGLRFVDRLVQDFRLGANTYSEAGEALFEARVGGTLVGIVGLNRDPYADGKEVGRLRHLYVHPDCRGRGVGKLLVDTVETAAKACFSQLRLFTDSEGAAEFYAGLGYTALHGVEHVSHVKVLSAAEVEHLTDQAPTST